MMGFMHWLGQPPSDEHEMLMDILVACHQEAAIRNNNASSAAVVNTASVGSHLGLSVASALLTLGGDLHGPTEKCRRVIFEWSDDHIREALAAGQRIPGWGNHFFHDATDPAWSRMEKHIREHYPDCAARLDAISEIVSESRGRRFYPNAAAYTSVVAQILDLTNGIELLLVIVARLPAWARQHLTAKP